MVELSDSGRRLVCRWLFVGFCILPTLAIGYWLLHPFTAADWQREIQARLGLDLHCQRVETPVPGKYVFHNVTFGDPELASLGTIPELIVATGDVGHVYLPNGLQGDTVAVRRLIELVTTGLGETSGLRRIWQVHADKVLLQSLNQHADSLMASDVTIAISPVEQNGAIANLKFNIIGDQTGSVYQFSCEQMALGNGKTGKRLYISTDEGSLPSWIFGEVEPEFAFLGQRSHVMTLVELRDVGAGWAGTVQGDLLQLDLAEASKSLPLRARGAANARLRCQFANGRVSEMNCELHASNGEIPGQWFRAITQDNQPVVELQQFQELHTNFNVVNNRIVFQPNQGQSGQWLWSNNELVFNVESAIELPLPNMIHQLTSDGSSESLATFSTDQLSNLGVDALSHFQLDGSDRYATQSDRDLH
ncbi:MAG: hypothetical protein R3C03_05925 [Pirellulaceae bacterium]